MNTNEQSQVAVGESTQSADVKVKAYQKTFAHPKKPTVSQISDPFSYPPSSRTYQTALLNKILNMAPKTQSETLDVVTVTAPAETVDTNTDTAQPKRGRGRPAGVKNKPKTTEVIASQTAQEVDSPALARGRKPSLRKLREKLGLNQSSMATKLGVTQAMVSFIESGKMKASEELQNKISVIYHSN